jgi:hypothetical protein
MPNLGNIGASVGSSAANAGSTAANVGSAASKANPYIEGGKVIGELLIGTIDASKRRQMDYTFNQKKLQSEL